MPAEMKRATGAGIAVAALAMALFGSPVAAQQQVMQQSATPLEVGAVAPDFAVPGATRYGTLAEPIRLSDFKGKTVVLAFFPRARTRGCTIQMHKYRDEYADLFRSGQDVVLIAMSVDPIADLHAWARDDQFQFLMASDVGMAVAGQYGAAREAGFTSRNLFVIGPDGRIAFTAVPFREIDPTAYEELGAALAKLVGDQDR